MDLSIIYLFATFVMAKPSYGFNYTEFFLNRNPYMARQVISGYEEFSAGVSAALGLTGPGQNLTNLRGYADGTNADVGSVNTNYKSTFGVTTLLAVANERVWGNMRVPGFENVLRSVPPALPDLMGILFKAAQQDYNTKIRTFVFTPTYVKTTLNLAQLKTEVKQAFFQLPERTMEGINEVIRTKTSGIPSFPDYLTAPLPESTEALMVTMKEQRGFWPDLTTSVGTLPFRTSVNSSGEATNMFDLQGDFWYGEDERFQFVKLPLKATQLQLTLILPKDFDSAAEWKLLKAMNSIQLSRSNLRLRLPVKSFYSRSPLKTNSSSCSSEASNIASPCMNFLDTLTYTSFMPSEFKFVSLTGAAVDNPYVSLLRSQMPFRGLPPLDRWRLLLPPKSHFRHRSRLSNYRSRHFELPRLWRSSASFSRPRYNSGYGNERLLIFDRPFFWFVKGNV